MLSDAVRAAAQARPRTSVRQPPKPPPVHTPVLPQQRRAVVTATTRMIAIGASTGGVEALRTIVAELPAHAPAIVVVQHMPEGFTAAFANRLAEGVRVLVREACDGDAIVPGTVLIAPGGRHLEVRRGPRGLVAHVSRGPLVARHRPSVDVLFRSVAALAGRDTVGVLLTGMGDDGAAGMRALRAAGARTLAQDEASSVVFGMPRAAIEAGVVDEVVPLSRMASVMLG
jgi:two-component system chemotaxis response regulator CheB